MKRLSLAFTVLFAIFSAGPVLYGQNAEDPMSQLDSTVKSLAADLNKALADNQAGKVSIGQFNYRNAFPPLSAYWVTQLTEELTNIPIKSFTLLAAGSAGVEWTITGEIVLISHTLRVYTRLVRISDRSIMTSLHSEFEYTQPFVEMLSGGGSSGGVSSVPDAFEPDSQTDPMSAEIGANEGSAPLVNRTIHDREDQDFFLLTPDKDGILVVETTGGLDSFLELYDAETNNRLAENDDGGSGGNARIRQSVSAGGRYVAKVRGYSSETGDYSLRAYIVERVQVAPDEYESDDDFSAAKDISIGTPQQHNFNSGDDVDWVKFQVTEAGRYIIRARGVESNSLDTYIELFDDNRNSIDEDDDGGDNLDSRLSVRLQSGTYYLSVKCLDSEPNQPYTISITTE
jgi:hypothetical protein